MGGGGGGGGGGGNSPQSSQSPSPLPTPMCMAIVTLRTSCAPNQLVTSILIIINRDYCGLAVTHPTILTCSFQSSRVSLDQHLGSTGLLEYCLQFFCSPNNRAAAQTRPLSLGSPECIWPIFSLIVLSWQH